MIARVEKEFAQFLQRAKRLSIHKYRFTMLHQFKEYNRAVCVMPGGKKTKIIN